MMKTYPVRDEPTDSFTMDPTVDGSKGEQQGKAPPLKNIHDVGDTVLSAVRFKKKKKGRLGKFLKNYSQIKGLVHENRRIDYVLVYPVENSKKKDENRKDEDVEAAEHRRELFEGEIKKEGLEIHEDVIGDYVYKKLHCPFARLCIEAEKTRLELPLKDMEIKKPPENSFLGRFWDMFETDDTEDFDSAPFDLDRIEKFQNYNDPTKFFRPALRSLLTHHILINIDIGRSIDKENEKDYSSSCFPCGKSRSKKDNKAKIAMEKEKDKNIRKRGLLFLMMKEDYSDAYILHDESVASQKKEKQTPLGELTTVLDEEVTSHILQEDARKELDERWTKFYKFQPSWRIRDYFGEKIALYFAWSGTLITTIYLPTLFGFIVFLYGLILSIKKNEELLEIRENNSTLTQVTETVQNLIIVIRESFDNDITPWFALVICMWGTIFLEYWKRRNAVLAYEWDVDDFEDNQPDRPQFYGKVKQDPITREFHLFYPFKRKFLKLMASGSALLFMMMLVLISVVGVIVYRVIVSVDICPNMSASSCLVVSTIFSSVFNAVSILILGRIYEKLAEVLTDWENHRTQTEYDDALTIKLFCFQFVNSYASCFYIAFFRGRFDAGGVLGRGDKYKDSCQHSCMSQLSFQVLVLMLMKPFPKLLKDIILPVLKDKLWIHRPKWCCRLRCCKNNQVNKNSGTHEHFTEKELRKERQRAFLVKERLKPPLGDFTLSEYTEKVIQYGFLMLFTASFPLAPLIALVTNYIDIRVDAKRLLWLNRRPIAFIAQDIGTWYSILQFVNFCGVVSNGFIIGFTSTWANKNYPDTSSRLWIVMLFEHVVFAIKFILAFLIPDVPADVKLAIRREKFNVRKILAEGKYDMYKKKHARNGSVENESEKKPKRGLQTRLTKNHLDPEFDFVQEHHHEIENRNNQYSSDTNLTRRHKSKDGAAVDIDYRGRQENRSTVWNINLPENSSYTSTSYV